MRRSCCILPSMLVAIALIAPATVRAQASQPPVDRPNILLIITDQQHAGMLSCAGNAHLQTPALDALAAAGTRFGLAYAANPVCVPSRFSLQTGRMPSAIGMGSNQGQLPVPESMSAASLGPLFKRAGYHCVYGGKDHTPGALSRHMMREGYERLTADERDELAGACAEFLKRPHDRPFLLVASFINPHDICYMAINDFARSQGKAVNANVGSRFCEKLLEEARTAGDLSRFVREKCPPLPPNFEVPADEPECIRTEYVDAAPFRRFAREQWSQDMWRLHRWLYCRLTESVDEQVGTVLRALRESGLQERTLVVFTSDHGDMDGAHRLEHKSVLYEESVHIPLIVTWKGRLPAGKFDDRHLVSNGLDLLPTLCDFAGVTPPAGLPGRSLRPVLEGKEVAWRDHVVAESQNGRMVRTARYKYSVYDRGTSREVLVDLESDPGEMKNLARLIEHREEIDHHRRLLLDWVQTQGDEIGLKYVVGSGAVRSQK